MVKIKMERERIIVPFERKALDSEGVFEGYGSTFGNVDFGGDIIAKGAFLDSLAEWKEKEELPLMPWFHDTKMPVGDWLEMREDDVGLFVKGSLWLGQKQIESSKMVHNLLTGTGPKGMSIGFTSQASDFKEIEMDGELRTIRVIKKAKLFELSIVPFGMNPNARVTSAKSLLDEEGKLVDLKTFEKTLRDVGLSSTQAKIVVSKGYKALIRDVDRANDISNDTRDATVSMSEVLESIKLNTKLFLST